MFDLPGSGVDASSLRWIRTAGILSGESQSVDTEAVIGPVDHDDRNVKHGRQPRSTRGVGGLRVASSSMHHPSFR